MSKIGERNFLALQSTLIRLMNKGRMPFLCSMIIAVRGYGVDSDNVQIQINGTTIYVIAPILKIEDRGIWENYHVLRYTFEFRDAETDAPYCLLQSVELCS